MTITLTLPPEAERELRERAAASGQTVESFIRDLVEREVISPGGGHASTAPPLPRPAEAILEPIRRKFEESGMSEEELTQFLTEVRDEARREKRAQKAI